MAYPHLIREVGPDRDSRLPGAHHGADAGTDCGTDRSEASCA